MHVDLFHQRSKEGEGRLDHIIIEFDKFGIQSNFSKHVHHPWRNSFGACKSVLAFKSKVTDMNRCATVTVKSDVPIRFFLSMRPFLLPCARLHTVN